MPEKSSNSIVSQIIIGVVTGVVTTIILVNLGYKERGASTPASQTNSTKTESVNSLYFP